MRQAGVRDFIATTQVRDGEVGEGPEARQAGVRDLLATTQVQTGEVGEAREARQAGVRDINTVHIPETAQSQGGQERESLLQKREITQFYEAHIQRVDFFDRGTVAIEP